MQTLSVASNTRHLEPASEAVPGADEFLCSILRGARADWPQGAYSFHSRLLDASTYHGVGPLLYHRLKRSARWRTWPAEVREVLRRGALMQVATESIRRAATIQALNALAGSGVRPLLMKGTPLAYSVYPSPALRPRCDTDLLIDEDDRASAQRVLSNLGYESSVGVSGDLISSQCLYRKALQGGVNNALDVHWRVNNRQRFAHSLSYRELARDAVPIPALGDRAHALAPVHALLLACVHRSAHDAFGQGNRLIWLYDLHLLLGRMSIHELQRFRRLAESRQVLESCVDGVERSRHCFGTRLPRAFLDALPAPVLKPRSMGELASMLDDVRALRGWRQKCRLLREHAFPPAGYMLKHYRMSSRRWLPVRYLTRAIHGLWKLIRARLNPC